MSTLKIELTFVLLFWQNFAGKSLFHMNFYHMLFNRWLVKEKFWAKITIILRCSEENIFHKPKFNFSWLYFRLFFFFLWSTWRCRWILDFLWFSFYDLSKASLDGICCVENNLSESWIRQANETYSCLVGFWSEYYSKAPAHEVDQ